MTFDDVLPGEPITNIFPQGGKKRLKKLVKNSIPQTAKIPHVIKTPKSQDQGTAQSDSALPGNHETLSERTEHDVKTEPLKQAEYGTMSNGEETSEEQSRDTISGTGSIRLPPPALQHDTSRRSSAPVARRPQVGPRLNDRSPLLSPTYEGPTSAPVISDRDTTAIESQMSKIASEKDFLSWLDSELDKIENFYLEKESEAIEKFLILQDQLHKLQNHRRKSKHKPTTTLNRAAKGTKLILIRKIGLPSLPVMMHNWVSSEKENLDRMHDMEDHNAATGESHTDDYSRQKGSKVVYGDAKRQLKSALSEYYRSLELLKGYRALNQTGIRKMIKKFDKTTNRAESAAYMEKVKSSEFAKSDVLDNLTAKTEDLYARYFENGNHKQAVEKLRSKVYPAQHYSEMFTSGLFLGFSVPLFIQALYIGIKHLVEGTHPDTTYLFQVWGGFFIVNLMLILFTLNLYAWTKYKINYPFIFEFDQRHFLDYRQYGEIPAFLMFLLSLFAWLTFNDFFPDTYPARYFPPIYLGIAVFIWFLPLPLLHYRSRRWLLVAFWRLLLSGLYPVEFRDFFLGDILTSMTYSVSNASFFFCLYANHWGDVFPGSRQVAKCTSSHSRLLGFLNCLPGIWRFMQCLRRFGDTSDWFPHLANAGKYSFQILYYVFLSIIRIDKGHSNTLRALFITFASINAVYSSIWDVLMDFSLVQPESRNYLLRDELGFPSKIPYYAIMVIDPILRFNWVFYAAYSRQIQQSAKISFIVALIEVIRRFLWVFFRVENEHCTNVSRFRASRDLTLPYQIAMRPKEEKRESNETPSGDSSALCRRSLIYRRAATTAFDVLNRDEEHTGGVSENLPGGRRFSEHEPQQPSRLQRRGTIASIATPVMRAVGAAHARDFERRNVPAYPEADDDDEEDDEYESESELETTNNT